LLNNFSIIVSMFNTNAIAFEKAIEGIPPEQWLARPGEDSNHLTWIAGHLVVMRALVPKLLGQEWSAPWEHVFARGAKLVPPEQYPHPTAIKQAWREVSDKLSATVENVSPELLAKPAPQKDFSLDGKIGGAIALLSLHETYHVGQLGYLRKWLGHDRALG
jgi:uncharacterized damage-inducible protein DinB